MKKIKIKFNKQVRPGETWNINDAKTRGHKSTITMVKNGEIKHIPRTHSPVTRQMNNIKLQVNPDENDNKAAYIIPKVQKSAIKHVGKKVENQDIKDPIDKSIIRHLKKQDKKKK